MKKNNENNENIGKTKSLDEKIKVFKTVYFMIIGILIVFAFLYKIFTNTIILDLSKLNYSDLLSLCISLFAIGISIEFYFKASDTSNKFYDNTYKFTKDISETIGRMEERFGERLKHMDEGYTRILDRGFSTTADLKNREEEIEKEKIELVEKINENEAIISQLIESNELSKEDKKQYLDELNKSAQEMYMLKNKIRELENQYNFENSIIDKNAVDILYNELIRYLPASVIDNIMSNKVDFDVVLKYLPNESLRTLRRAGLINNSGEPTWQALEAFSYIINIRNL